MTPRSAHAHAYRYVEGCRKNLTLQARLRESGLDIRYLARKLAQLMDATEKKWNLATRQWDSFDNHAAQLEAIKQTARLLNLYPAERSKVESEQVNVINHRCTAVRTPNRERWPWRWSRVNQSEINFHWRGTPGRDFEWIVMCDLALSVAETPGAPKQANGVRIALDAAIRSIHWAGKQENFQSEWRCFFLTSPFIELMRHYPVCQAAVNKVI
jgi:hypothetical protein